MKSRKACLRIFITVMAFVLGCVSAPASAIPISTVVTYLGVAKSIGEGIVNLKDYFSNIPLSVAKLSASGGATSFDLTFTGGPFDSDNVADFSGVTSMQKDIGNGNIIPVPVWQWDFHVFENYRYLISDEITVNGSVHHIFNPDDGVTHILPAASLVYADKISAENPISTPSGPKVFANDAPKTGIHAPHKDVLSEASLVGTVTENTIVGNSFSGYNLHLYATHVPEPSTFLLLILGIGVLRFFVIHNAVRSNP